MGQMTFTDAEYANRAVIPEREIFLNTMNEIIPWNDWVAMIEPYYYHNKVGRPAIGIEKMLRMYLLQCWFNMSDKGLEGNIYDSYSMRSFLGIDFHKERAPDATTLCKFRNLLVEMRNSQEDIR